VNLRGAIWGCKSVGKRMLSNRRGGCIINVSSLLGMKGTPGTAVYAASKAGLLGESRPFRLEQSSAMTHTDIPTPFLFISSIQRQIGQRELSNPVVYNQD
jgi:NAD(P)-dependent dehydrogenase (short-subunit alcohol dehydrogenase family)